MRKDQKGRNGRSTKLCTDGTVGERREGGREKRKAEEKKEKKGVHLFDTDNS